MGDNKTPADKVEDEVLNVLPTLNAAELEEVCGVIKLEVKEAMKGNRRLLRKAVMKFLCAGDEDGEQDRMAEFLLLFDHLQLNDNADEDAEEDGGTKKVEKKAETAVEQKNVEQTDTKVKEEETDSADDRVKSSSTSTTTKTDDSTSSSSSTRKRTEEYVTTRTIRKEFKLPNMIGGDSPNALSFSSLKFEISKGRKQGHHDSEICSAIISKVADKELKEYFENEPDIELEDVLDMLKSVCTEKQKSSAAFTIFTNDEQGENEKPMSFITRVLRLRKRVAELGKEEGCLYPAKMLTERAQEVVLGGLRDTEIQSALREKWKDNMTDKKILSCAAAIVAAEMERKRKLFGKPKDKVKECDAVEVNEISQGHEKNEKKARGARPNPFAEIDELKLQIAERDNRLAKRDDEFKAELNEIKQLIVDKNEDRPRKSSRKCPKCVAENRFRCRHCWECGADDHRRGDPNCPEN